MSNVSAAIKALEKIEEYQAVVLSQSFLCVAYPPETKETQLQEHIDGIKDPKRTTPENNLYAVSIPLTLLPGSAPEFHLIKGRQIIKYKFQANHALCFAANQGHSTASLGTCTWPPPNNIRVNLMLVVGDRNYLNNKPKYFKEQILVMSDPCYPSSTLEMDAMLNENPTAGDGTEEARASFDRQWNTYLNEWMATYDDAYNHFETCMKNNN